MSFCFAKLNWYISLSLYYQPISHTAKNFVQKVALRKKCPYLEFFWSVFSHIFPLFLELKLNTKQDTVQDRTPLFLFIKYIKIKFRKRKTVNLQMGKMSKAIEVNKLHPLQAKMKQKYSCGKDIKTRKKPKSKEKIEAKHAI